MGKDGRGGQEKSSPFVVDFGSPCQKEVKRELIGILKGFLTKNAIQLH